MFKLFHKKLSQKSLFGRKEGFTLIELMIVIAIIGILAVVLIPQAGKMRDNAKLTGVDSNARLIVAQAQSMIVDYDTKSGFAAALISKFNSATLAAATITNPINNAFNVPAAITTGVISATNPTATSAATIFYLAGTADTATSYNSTLASDGSGTVVKNNANLAGSVVIVLYGNNTAGNLDGMVVYTFDKNGTAMASTAKAASYTVAK